MKRLAVNPEDVVLDADGVPTSIRVFKPGDNPDVRGLNVVYDPKRAQAIMDANTRADGTVPFDVAHGMTSKDAKPEMHEGVGWGKLRCDDTGVWLDDISWRDDYRRKLLDGSFRFISPTFTIDREGDGDKERAFVHDLLTVALTNIPATIDAPAIVNDRQVRRSAVAFAAVGRATTDIPRDRTMSKQAADATVAEDLELTKREAGDDEDDKDDGEEPDGDEVEREDDGYDFENIDLESMDVAELRKFGAYALDTIADLQAEARKRDEASEADDDEEKRSIVNGLFTERLISFSQKKGLLGLSLRDLRNKEKELRAKPGASRALAKREQRGTDRPYQNSLVRSLHTGQQLGATDADIESYLRAHGHTAEKFGIETRSDRAWGTRLPYGLAKGN